MKGNMHGETASLRLLGPVAPTLIEAIFVRKLSSI